MKFSIFLAILFLAFAVNGLIAQTSQNGNFEFVEQGAYDAKADATDTGETVSAYGQAFKIFQTPQGKRFAQIRGKYLVWSTFEVVDNLPDGTPIYATPSGTPFIFAMGKNGVYARYGKRK